jgi:hypothetical protein
VAPRFRAARLNSPLPEPTSRKQVVGPQHAAQRLLRLTNAVVVEHRQEA